MFKVYMAGGGTGGHLFPGISLAQAIKARETDARIKFLVSGKRLDTALLEDKGFECVKVEQRHLPHSPGQVADFMITNARALWQVTRMMMKDRPEVVVGLGGYASFAAAAAAKICGVPLVLLEQNAVPGKTNRALSLAADRVFCQWSQASRYFMRRGNLKFKGNPVRDSLKKLSKEIARTMLGLESDRNTLMVLGGSQGASSLNRIMIESIPIIEEWSDRLQIIHLAGSSQAEIVEESYREAGIKAKVFDFLKEMHLAYSAADLVFCRAGGTTIAELTAMGIPSILVPYPHASDNHQLANAKALASRGAARIIEEKHVSSEKIEKEVIGLLLDESALKLMSANAVAAGRPEAATEIAGNIVESYRKNEKNSFAQLLNV